jgi:hypothetical protein
MIVCVRKCQFSLGGAACLIAGLVLAGSSCVDPVVDEAIEALGPEQAKVPPGPLHRPGQPCVVCHNDESGEAGPFTLAGTVYLDALSNTPVGDVQVTIIDSKANSFTLATNCAGNFFVRPSQFVPVYPYWVEMNAGQVYRSMDTASFREGSCSGCHADPKGQSSAGHVYLIDDPENEKPPPSQCP